MVRRKTAEQAAEEGRALIESTFAAMGDALLVIEPKGRNVIACNAGFERMFGYTEAEILGRNTRLLYADNDSYPEFSARVGAQLDAGGEFRGEFELRRKDGSIFPCEVTSSEIRDERGKRSSVVSIVRDISERRAAEQALRESEARFSGIVTIAPDAIIAIDNQQHISLFNQSAVDTFGYAEEEILGQHVETLIPTRFRHDHDAQVREFANSDVASRSMSSRNEIVGLRKDNSEFPAEASLSKLRLGDETIMTVMLHDITERKRAEAAVVLAKEQAEIADRAKSEFLANMSHELRTPLNAILGFAQLIRDQAFGSRAMDRYVGYAGDINDSGEHLLAIVNDILDLSKIEAGKTELDEHEIDAEKIVDACETLVKGRARDFGISLRTDIGNCGVKFLADERMIKQVLLNLLSNAIKFTSAGGHVVISAHRADNGRLEFQVTDDGIGIASEDLPKVLTTFGQVQGAMTRDHEGTGLGLPLVASLAKLHGGGLDLESEIGVGTTATVWFPKERVVVSS
ncbi:MAG: PAS domain S-box protein [Alphaproteobacteria bacterium]|nr:PAS domain S-box protein [Alphaproteobacteria bacterium]